jgi:hypothetical protein
MDSGNGLMSAIIAVLAGMLICVVVMNTTVASTRSTTGHRRRVRGVCRLARHRWTPPANRTIQWTTRSPPRGADGLLPRTGFTASDTPTRRCQRTVGPSEPAGQGRRLRPELLRFHTPASTRSAARSRSPTSTCSIPPNPRQSGLSESELCRPDLNRRPLEIDGSC